MEPLRKMARTSAALLRIFTPAAPYGIALRHVNASLEVFAMRKQLINARPTPSTRSWSQ